ncbi:hypothetical protein [Microbacterium phyllosphaerae]|uniref:hypothetical protein n=1 Tax=Microbacterium phyllosphaerae TaxID=124798 RepID=UPI00216A9667|nr:hypothetical protein [Microbacterium phyllosphaerae]MCS3443345.1 uncharacterized membrane protein YhaH (DUF805 family) [Microbacterium phyllosphaerae]
MTAPAPAPVPSPGPPAGHFDARPLLEPVDPAEVDAFARAQRTAHPSSAGQIIAWVFAGFALLCVVPVIAIMIMGLGYAIGRGTGVAVGGILGLLLLAGLVVGIVMLVRRGIRTRNLTRFRLARFAQANAMSYFARIDDPPLPGMIFSSGSARMSTDVLRGVDPRFVEFGNYQYTTSNGKQSQTHRWGYVAVKLDVPLPNIVLDALGNNTLGSTIAGAFSGDQRLSLEGDFDRYFSLYCPAGYEVDALYLFTPDVMARFIDHAAQLDVEIVDDWLFLYARREVSTLDPATWAWLFGAVGALLTKLDQWARWRDDRLRLSTPHPGFAGVAAQAGPPSPAASPGMPGAPALPFAAPQGLLTPPPGVAPPGQRLKRRSPWLIIGIIVGVMFVVTMAPFAIGIFSFLFLG